MKAQSKCVPAKTAISMDCQKAVAVVTREPIICRERIQEKGEQEVGGGEVLLDRTNGGPVRLSYAPLVAWDASSNTTCDEWIAQHPMSLMLLDWEPVW